MPLADQFLRDWERFHPGEKPIGWMLRRNNSLPWVRCHALPASKRYAENDEERAVIFARATALGDRLLGDGSPCWIVETQSHEAPALGEPVGEWSEGLDPDELTWRFYARLGEWNAETHREKLRAIADDQPGWTIWFAPETGSIFAPYDGGFDLFPPTWQAAEQLKIERPEWLSPRLDGL